MKEIYLFGSSCTWLAITGCLTSRAGQHHISQFRASLDLARQPPPTLAKKNILFIGSIICAAFCHKPPHIESLIAYAWNLFIYCSRPQYFDKKLLHGLLPLATSYRELESLTGASYCFWKFIILTPDFSLKKGIYQVDPAFARLLVTVFLTSRAWQSYGSLFGIYIFFLISRPQTFGR